MKSGGLEASPDSLRKRYLFKLGTNLIRVPVGFALNAIIPRILGPAAYGDFNFLAAFFNKLFGFFETGTSQAFYTKLSRRNRDLGLVRFYWALVALLVLGAGCLVAGVFLVDLQGSLWPELSPGLVWLGFVWGGFVWVRDVFLKMVDAYALTTRGELARVAQQVLAVAVIAVLYWQLGRISLPGFFLYKYALALALIVAFAYVLGRHGFRVLPVEPLSYGELRSYVKEFWDYSGPLIVYSAVGLVVGVGDRWLLQTFGGSVQQGFYSLSHRVSRLALLFTSAMVPLFIRRLSRAFGEDDLAEMRRVFWRAGRMLYAVATCLALFVAFRAETVTYLLGGDAYARAATAVTIMALFPVHQTYGQLSGAVFLASERTREYRNVGVVFMVLGITTTFLLVAPDRLGGLALGATGLSLKMVAVQVLAVNAQLYLNARYLDLSYPKILGHQIAVLAVFGAAVYGATAVVDRLVDARILQLLLSGMLYLGLCGAIVGLAPGLAGTTRDEMMQMIRNPRSWIGG